MMSQSELQNEGPRFDPEKGSRHTFDKIFCAGEEVKK